MALGCYTAPYLPASFKGVSFEALEAGSEHGRRGAEGEFPFGEDTAYADLGRKIRRYSLKARFVQNSHVDDANALIAACESPGSGVLVHPTRGIVSAACTSCKVQDQVLDEQGYSTADLEFVEANEFPAGLRFGGTIGIIVSGVVAAARAAFLSNYNVAPVSNSINGSGGRTSQTTANANLLRYTSGAAPTYAAPHRRDAVTAAASGQILKLRDEYSVASINTGERASAPQTLGSYYNTDVPVVTSSSAQKLGDFYKDENTSKALRDFYNIAANPTLLLDGTVVADTITLGIAAIANNTKADTKLAAMKRIANNAARVSPLPGKAGQAENALYALTRITAGAFMAQAAIEATFATSEDAFAYLDATVATLTSEANVAYLECDNELFLELRSFIIDFQRQLYAKAYKLPALIQYNFGRSVHPLVAAYDIFNDARRHRELENGNLVSGTGRFGSIVTGSSA